MSLEASPSKFHPRYESNGGDLILASKDEVQFRVHATLLQHSSGFFKSMLEIPREAEEGPDSPIPVAENSKLLASLLDFIYPMESYPKPSSTAEAQEILQAAEKYNIPRVLSIMQSIMLGDDLLYSDSLDVYILACTWGWKDVAKKASRETLKIDLFLPTTLEKLFTLEKADIQRLLLLHTDRKDRILRHLDPNREPKPGEVAFEFPQYYAPFSFVLNCNCWRPTDPDEEDWVTPTLTSMTEMVGGSLVRRPLGDQLRKRDFWDYRFDYARKCRCRRCDKVVINLDSIISDILEEVNVWAPECITYD